MEKSKLIRTIKEITLATAVNVAFLVGLAGFTYVGTKILMPLADMYFEPLKPRIVYYSEGQPVGFKEFETNEEMQAYEDTSTVHKMQLELLKNH